MNKIAVIGLGYVGLPLAVEFAKKHHTIGYDIDSTRINELKNGHDHTLEITDEHLQQLSKESSSSHSIKFSNTSCDMATCNYFIVTVPTPTDKHNRPNLNALIKASQTIGKILKKGDTVIYESTVYPGATEEECVPILEEYSELKFNIDFFAAYSPERINPGDKEHTITKIKKVTSGSTPEVAEKVDQLYKSIIVAGTHKASSIKVAEAAKVIENSQRDINIAFVNELAKIFNHLNIDTNEVLEAASTKWNFLPFKPGLVGGHCIGVDPYYLAQKAQEAGYNPEIILAGRRMNDSMGAWVATEVIKLMIKKGHVIKDSKVLCLGITFKENCPDIRNSRAIDVIRELQSFGCLVHVYDPWANANEVEHTYQIALIDDFRNQKYDAVVLSVAHNDFININLSELRNGNKAIIYDIKNIWPTNQIDGRL